jgi:hypothetical protein
LKKKFYENSTANRLNLIANDFFPAFRDFPLAFRDFTSLFRRLPPLFRYFTSIFRYFSSAFRYLSPPFRCFPLAFRDFTSIFRRLPSLFNVIEYRHRKSRRDEIFIEKQQTQLLAKRRRRDMTVPGSEKRGAIGFSNQFELHPTKTQRTQSSFFAVYAPLWDTDCYILRHDFAHGIDRSKIQRFKGFRKECLACQ